MHRLSSKSVTKFSLDIPPRVKPVANLPCEIFVTYLTDSRQIFIDTLAA